MNTVRPEHLSENDTCEDFASPAMFEVLLFNDDYTTMEFVVSILIHVFHKQPDAATAIMLSIHNSGHGVAGTYPFEVAETKVETVHNMARSAGFPLRCEMREV